MFGTPSLLGLMIAVIGLMSAVITLICYIIKYGPDEVIRRVGRFLKRVWHFIVGERPGSATNDVYKGEPPKSSGKEQGQFTPAEQEEIKYFRAQLGIDNVRAVDKTFHLEKALLCKVRDKKCRMEIIRWLVHQGVDVNAKDWRNNEQTPIHLALAANNIEVAKYLFSQGGNVHAKNKLCVTPLHLAANIGNLEIVEYLVSQNVDINVRDINDDTPLHDSAGAGKAEIAKYLVQHGADVNAKNRDGKTPLHLAASSGNLAIIECLVQHGADVNAKNRDGKTPLHLAASYGNLAIIECLVQHGADVNAKNRDGKTPLQCAAINIPNTWWSGFTPEKKKIIQLLKNQKR